MPGFRSAQPPTQILSVMTACRESYSAASQLDRRVFGTHAAFPETLFDFRKDTLYLRYDMFPKVDPELYTMLDPLLSLTDPASLQKEQNLAILTDNELGDYKMSSEYIQVLFTNNFTKLKNLTLVLGNYNLDGEDRQSNFTFIDPIDVGKTMEAYGKFAPVSYGQEPLKIPTQSMLSHELVDFDLKHLKNAWNRNEIQGNRHAPLCKIPNIHFKIAVTTSTQDRLDLARARCEVIVAHLNQDLLISWGQ